MKRLLITLLLVTSALGQRWSPAELKTHIATNLPSASRLTAQMLRETMTNIVTSVLFSTNSLIDVDSASAARVNLGVAIGSDVQAYDSQLDDLSSGSLTGYIIGAGVGPYTASSTIPSTAISGTLSVSVGGTGAGTLTGHLSGNGTSPITASSTIPASDLSGLGTGIFSWLATPSSANLATALTDETGTGGGFVRADGASVTNMSFGVAGSAQKVAVFGSGNVLSYGNASSTDLNAIVGLNGLTGHLSANGGSAVTASSTIPATDLSGTIDNARLDSTVVITTTEQTLTDKRVTPRAGYSTVSAATLYFHSDSYDVVEVDALTSSVTLVYITGTPKDGQTLRLSFRQDGTGGYTITWPAGVAFGTDYTAAMVPTAASAKWQMTLTYNYTDSKWRVTGMARGF